MESTHLQKIEKYSTELLTEHLSEKMVFHDIAYTLRLIEDIREIAEAEKVSEEDKEVVMMAGWLSNLGFTHTDLLKKVSSPEDLFALCYQCSIMMSKNFLEEIKLPEETKTRVFALLEEVKPGVEVKSHLGMILSDAIAAEWGRPKSKGKVKKLYDEFILTGAVSYGKSTWYDTVLGYLIKHKYYTDYAKGKYDDKKLELLAKIEKEQKDLDKKANLIIKKEMDISETELKKLKKSLSSVKGRDDRGIQTLFRTTSRNHYTLNQMMDRKANIMISINAILLSLIISRTIGGLDTYCIHNLPILILLLFAMASMIFAVMAITPFKTQGTFTESEIREKKGNLLYYGNFHSMNLRDFEWGMLEMLSDGDFLYSTMIRDLYFLGETLHKKSRMIRMSLGMFILGVIISTIIFVIVASMDDFHFGVATHI